jgi:hypothetical protein
MINTRSDAFDMTQPLQASPMNLRKCGGSKVDTMLPEPVMSRLFLVALFSALLAGCASNAYRRDPVNQTVAEDVTDVQNRNAPVYASPGPRVGVGVGIGSWGRRSGGGIGIGLGF